MRTVQQWLDEYGASHQHPTNKRLHWLCVPPIVLTVIGFLWALPVPAAARTAGSWLNWGTLAIVLSVAYYSWLSPRLAMGATVALVALAAIVAWLDRLAWPLWGICLGIFVVAWIGQFIGHAIEGKRPSFFKDVQFLLIGPLWLLSFLYRRAGIRY
ncbi:MAG TPA: DUF962 domain-containing protein [Steroidobacteraceae bacterium]|nr:DUF962 domain-containing protein [Steroidobacteraceae bacterium]